MIKYAREARAGWNIFTRVSKPHEPEYPHNVTESVDPVMSKDDKIDTMNYLIDRLDMFKVTREQARHTMDQYKLSGILTYRALTLIAAGLQTAREGFAFQSNDNLIIHTDNGIIEAKELATRFINDYYPISAMYIRGCFRLKDIEYQGGRPGLELVDYFGKSVRASINIPEAPEGLIIKSYSENEGLIEELTKHKLVKNVRIIPCGFAVAYLCERT